MPRGLTLAGAVTLGWGVPGGAHCIRGAFDALAVGFCFLECMRFTSSFICSGWEEGGLFSISFHKLHFPAGVC